jgi:hypothetical protein
MDDLLYARVLTLWLTSSPSAPEASVLSQLAQSDRHVDGSSWHHGAMACASVMIEPPIGEEIMPFCHDMKAWFGHLGMLGQRPLAMTDEAEVMLWWRPRRPNPTETKAKA